MKMKKSKIFFLAIGIIIVLVACIILISKNKEITYQQQLDLGNKALLNMSYEDAILAFNNAIQINPKNVEAYLGIAEAYIALEDYINACKYLEKGYEETADPSIFAMLESLQVNKYISLGKLYLSQGDANSAKDAFEEALKQDPSNENAANGIEESLNHPNFDPNMDSNNSSDSETTEENATENNTADDSSNDTDSSALGFDPYSFTFFGYPIHEDHYEELKASVGYTGNDTSNTLDCMSPGNGFAEKISCSIDGNTKNFSLIGEITPEEYFVGYAWWVLNDARSDFEISFGITPNAEYRPIAETQFDGPIKLGTSFTNAIDIIGYSREISAIGDSISLADGTILSLSEGDEYLGTEKTLNLHNDKFLLSFGFVNDTVETVHIYYN